MLRTAFLSMWISNTATAMMMVPIALAVVERVDETGSSGFEKTVFLGIAYSAPTGEAATLVETPPKLSLTRILSIQFPKAPEIEFVKWLAIGLQLAFVFLPVAWPLLLWLFRAWTIGERTGELPPFAYTWKPYVEQPVKNRSFISHFLACFG